MPIGQKLLNLSEYHRPGTETGLQETLALLARPNIRTRVLAGGDALVGSGDLSAEAVVDLQALGLDELVIDAVGGTLRAGAMVTRSALAGMSAADPGTPLHIIAAGARRWGGNVQRNRATLGGALVAAADNDALLVALLACDATILLMSRNGAYALPIADFLAKRAATLAEPAVLTEVSIALPTGEPAGYALADVARTPADAPIVVAAAALAFADGRCIRARLALGGVAACALRMPEVEALLEGQPLTADLISTAAARASAQAQPAGDFRGSAEYRAAMAGVLAERVLRQAWQSA